MATRASQRKRPPATDGGSDFDVVLSEAPVADSASLVGVRSERKKSDLEPEQSRSLPGETTPFEILLEGAPYIIARARCVTDARCLWLLPNSPVESAHSPAPTCTDRDDSAPRAAGGRAVSRVHRREAAARRVRRREDASSERAVAARRRQRREEELLVVAEARGQEVHDGHVRRAHRRHEAAQQSI